ncbi:MAG: recombinase [Cyanobacteria bacterium PR.023]|nr:recombinase [Cyanobacteria bacterium PR.023]
MASRIGYARISPLDQDSRLQLEALHQAGCDKIYEEKVSGVNTERPVLEQSLKSLQPGDTLVVWRMDRLGRSLKHLVEIVTYLVEWGRYFESLTDRIELSAQNGHDTLQVFKALAEFERNLLSERTTVGLQAAKARGRVGGRKEKLTDADKAIARNMIMKQGAPVSIVAEKLGVSRQTIYRQIDMHTLINESDTLKDLHEPNENYPA